MPSVARLARLRQPCMLDAGMASSAGGYPQQLAHANGHMVLRFKTHADQCPMTMTWRQLLRRACSSLP